MTEEIYKLITDKEKEFAELIQRYEDDKKLITEDYVMRNQDGVEEPDVDEVTLNGAQVFYTKVANTLVQATMEAEISGKDIDQEDELFMEGFFRDIDKFADKYIGYYDLPSYKDWEISQCLLRGTVARRVTLRPDGNGGLEPDSFTPVDSRYLLYETGVKGYKWVATRMVRKAEDVEEQYDVKPNGKYPIVTDFWDDEQNIVFIGKEAQEPNTNIYGEPPFVIQVMPTGLLTFDPDFNLRNGESIFDRNRKLYEPMNLFASILQTLTLKAFFNGLQLEVPDVASAKKPLLSPYRKKFVVPVEKGTRGYFEMPIQDLQNSAQLFYKLLDEHMQHGSLPKVSYGFYPAPASGVGLSELKEAEDPVYTPRIKGYTSFMGKLYRMILRQYQLLKLNVNLGEEGMETGYSYQKLGKKFSLGFWVDLDSAKQDMVNISTAAAVGNLVSEDTKRRKYLHIRNPQEEETKILNEEAERLSPAIKRYRVIKSLFKKGQTVEANLMAEELGLTLKQVISGQTEGIPDLNDARDKPQQLVPIYPNRGGKSTEEYNA